MDRADKEAVIAEYRVHDNDTGSTESQVAILTSRINQLTQHLREHNRDYHLLLGLPPILVKLFKKGEISYIIGFLITQSQRIQYYQSHHSYA